jgi:hypothetical protein
MKKGGERMELMVALYGYKFLREMERMKKRPIPEEMEYVEALLH